MTAGSRPSARRVSSTVSISSTVPRMAWPCMRRPAWRARSDRMPITR